jgi:hypothetical protein
MQRDSPAANGVGRDDMARWSAQVRSAPGRMAATSSPMFVVLVALRIRLIPMNQNVLLSRGREAVVEAWVSRLDARAGRWVMCRMTKRWVR